jgi:hypothetical protein
MRNNSESSFDILAIKNSIAQAVDFLWHNQLPYGEFKTYGKLVDSPEENFDFDSSPFVTSLIVYSLCFVETSQTKVMQEKSLNFLTEQMEDNGVWRYWSSYNPKRYLIPPDMDDTCCASFVLKKYNKAPRNHRIILANRHRNGLFYTWFLPRFSLLTKAPIFWLTSLPKVPIYRILWWKTEAKPNDIDCVVNCNVVLYLGEIEETKPVIAHLIDLLLKEQEIKYDKWYLSKFPHYYFLSRAYFNGIKKLEEVKEKVITNLEEAFADEGYKNPLDTALAACTFLNFDYITNTLHRAIEFLLKTQRTSGDWIRIPFYFGGPKGLYSFGSSELTTAFCIEALARYQQIIDRNS